MWVLMRATMPDFRMVTTLLLTIQTGVITGTVPGAVAGTQWV